MLDYSQRHAELNSNLGGRVAEDLCLIVDTLAWAGLVLGWAWHGLGPGLGI
jgi:hypothetical protein